jgi:hypothetical protein
MILKSLYQNTYSLTYFTLILLFSSLSINPFLFYVERVTDHASFVDNEPNYLEGSFVTKPVRLFPQLYFCIC